MKITMMKVSDLIPYVNNPRDNTDTVDKVVSSIKEYGFKNPILIDKNNVIINGHTRLLACKKIGLEVVPVIIADDLTQAQAKGLRIADNKIAEYSKWDNELLKLEIDMLKELDFDLDLTGLKEFEIDNLYLEFDAFDDLEGSDDELINEYEEPLEKIDIKGCCPSCGFKDNLSVFKYVEVD